MSSLLCAVAAVWLAASTHIVLGAAVAGALVMHFFFPPPELPFARLAG
jgi:hypothetical protein